MLILSRLLFKTVGVRYTVDNWFYRMPAATRAMFERLRDSAKGKPVLVVGNGPSLNQTPLEDFAGVPAFGMNKINLLFKRSSWRPTVILTMNNLVVRQNSDFFLTSDIPVFMAWKSRWFLGGRRGKNIHYFLSKPTPAFSRDVSQWVGALGYTVTYIAMQFAYFTGANPVILFGVDHSFQYKGADMEVVKSTGPDANHFDPNYFGPSMYWGTPDLAGNQRDYERAKAAFEDDGRTILDATVGGKLQLFRKISGAEAKDLCRVWH